MPQKDSPLYPDGQTDDAARKQLNYFVCLCVSTVCSVFLAVFVCVMVGYRVCLWVIPWMLDGDYANSLSPFVTITLCLNRINHEPDMHTHTCICRPECRKYESPDTYMCLPMCATLASSSHVPCSHNNGQQIKL